MSTELLPESETAADERLPEAALPDARAAASERTLQWPETAVEPVRVRWRYAIGIPLIHLLACLAFVPWLFSWTGVVLVRTQQWTTLHAGTARRG